MKKQIQGPYSKVCGLYAAFAIIKSHHNRRDSLKKLFEQFSGNFKINDSKILSFMYKQWPGESCHNNPLYNNNKNESRVIKETTSLLLQKNPVCQEMFQQM